MPQYCILSQEVHCFAPVIIKTGVPAIKSSLIDILEYTKFSLRISLDSLYYTIGIWKYFIYINFLIFMIK